MKKVLEPINIGKIELHNRLIMPPLETGKGYEDGKVSKEIVQFYDEKSKEGQLSLLIVEHSFVSPEGKASPKQLSVASDDVIPGLREVADVIHGNGSKTIVQISHAGSATKKEISGFEPVGPSSVENPRKKNIPIELSVDEIKELIRKFKEAAVRVKEAGFDGVEIHSAHGYLLNQFYSPLTNMRVDDYGGSLMNRIRIHLEIIRSVREAVGEEFPIFLRLGASDFIDGGTVIEDSVIAAAEFQRAGVDVLDVSGGFCGYTSPNMIEQGYFHPLTSALKKAVSIPVILTGGITDINVAEELLEEKKADIIGVGRAVLKDSNWAKNAIESIK